MSGDLVPEMHDVGKLVDWDKIKRTVADKLGMNRDELEFKGHSFIIMKGEKEVSYFTKVFDVEEIENNTWKIIKYHHEANIPENIRGSLKNDVELFLIRLADSMASSVSRAMEEEEREKIKAIVRNYENRSVYKLWNPEKVQDLNLISNKEFPSLVKFIHKNPAGEDFLEDVVYKKLLLVRPEDFTRSNDITSLYIHSKLVGKFYRFFEKRMIVEAPDRIVFGGRRANSPDNAESQWDIKLVKCSVKFTQNPVRGYDLNVFEKLKEIIYSITELDSVLFNTSTEFLAILSPDENVEAIIRPFLDSGFYLEVEEAYTNLGNAYPTPKTVKEREFFSSQKNIEKEIERLRIPDEVILEQRKQEIKEKRKQEFESKFPMKLVYHNLESKIDIPICESCQMAKGSKEWPRDYVVEKLLCADCKEKVRVDGWPLAEDKLCKNCIKRVGKLIEEFLTETLCEKCFEVRSMGARLPKIMDWSDSEDNPKVAWLKISVEIDKLEKVLKDLYLEYLKDLKIPDPEKYMDIRFSVLSEFQSDYDDFLKKQMGEDKEDAKKEVKGKFVDEFESVNCQWILSDFFCIKIDKTSDIKKILKIYNSLFANHFPKFKEEESPIKLSISCSSIKYAFFWHWKFLENPQSDINLNLVGKGELHLSMKQLDALLSPDFKQPGMSSLHKLSKVAEVSTRLSKILLYDKGDYRLYDEYMGLRRLLEGGIDFPNILTYAKMMSDLEEEAAK